MGKMIEKFVTNTLYWLWFGISVGAGVAMGFWAITKLYLS